MLFDPHHVADLELVVLVVRVVLLRAPNRLFEHRMSKATLDLDHHRLGLFVAYHDALQGTLWHLVPLNSSPRRGACCAQQSSIAQCHAALRARVRYFPIARWRAGNAD